MNLVVYGILRDEEEKMLDMVDIVKRHTMTLKGFKMIVLGAFPGILYDEDSEIVAELLVLDTTQKSEKRLLKQLDRIEGVAHGMYTREIINTEYGDAFIYVYCGKQQPDDIAITDWFEYEKHPGLCNRNGILVRVMNA